MIDYAIFGLGLLFFLNRAPRTILLAAITLFIVGEIFGGIIPDIREHQKQAYDHVSVIIDQPEPEKDIPAIIMEQGSFLQISTYRLSRVWKAFTNWCYYLSEIDLLGMMLMGFSVGRLGAVWDPEIRLKLARKSLPWLLGVGSLVCLIYVIMTDFNVADKTSFVHTIIQELAGWPFGKPVLGLGYVAIVTLLFENEFWKKSLSPFAAVGRTALTNYLFTGLVSAFISFSWGLGLYGEISAWQGLLVVIIIFPIQVLISKWWVSRFNYGPAEWLWRSMTYGKLPSMKRSISAN